MTFDHLKDNVRPIETMMQVRSVIDEPRR